MLLIGLQYANGQYECNKVFESLHETRNVHPDSVCYLELWKITLYSIPDEICNFRKLKYLDLTPSKLNQVPLDCLTVDQRKKLKKQLRLQDQIGLKVPAFKPKSIQSLPTCFYKLYDLKFIFIDENVNFNVALYDSLKKYLPSLEIDPPKYEYIDSRKWQRTLRRWKFYWRIVYWEPKKRKKGHMEKSPRYLD